MIMASVLDFLFRRQRKPRPAPEKKEPTYSFQVPYQSLYPETKKAIARAAEPQVFYEQPKPPADYSLYDAAASIALADSLASCFDSSPSFDSGGGSFGGGGATEGW